MPFLLELVLSRLDRLARAALQHVNVFVSTSPGMKRLGAVLDYTSSASDSHMSGAVLESSSPMHRQRALRPRSEPSSTWPGFSAALGCARVRFVSGREISLQPSGRGRRWRARTHLGRAEIMERLEFDRIARRIANGIDRRQLLRGVLGGSIAAAGLSRGVHAQSEEQNFDPGWYDAYGDGGLYYYDGEQYTGEADCGSSGGAGGEEIPAGWYPAEDGCSYYWDGTRYTGEQECGDAVPASGEDDQSAELTPRADADSMSAFEASLEQGDVATDESICRPLYACQRLQNTCEEHLNEGGDLDGCTFMKLEQVLGTPGLLDLREKQLAFSRWRGSTLFRIDLSNANLHGADLSDAKIMVSDLTGANLSDSVFESTAVQKMMREDPSIDRAERVRAISSG